MLTQVGKNMRLKELQLQFLEAITNPNYRHSLPLLSSRLNIHRTNINSNLVFAINDIYPITRKLLGDDCFANITQLYIKQYPTCRGNLYDYGQYFGTYLKEHSTLSEFIYLDEIAKFEWATHQIFFAADHSILNTERLKTISPSDYFRLHFMLHPACCLIEFNFPILKIIDLCNGIVADEIDLQKGGVNLLIIRSHLEITLVPLSACEFHFLKALQNRASLSKALKSTLQINLDFKLEEKLAHWIKNKTIVDFYL